MQRLSLLFLVILLITCQPQGSDDTLSIPGQSIDGYWHQQPLRILQTVLRQPDAENYNVDSVVSYMQKVHANVLVVNGGGIIDYFQNKLPMANINPYIGERDLLAEIVNGCHKADIRVIARVDFRGVDKERYELHPDWFARDENGQPIILNYTTPGLYAPCYNGYYRNEHAVAFISQLFEEYNIDGIWHNAVNFHNTCYCTRCQQLYHSEYQKEIPVNTSPAEEWEEYYRWNEKMANRQLGKMRATVKRYGEDKSYSAEVFDMYRVEQQKHTGIDLFSVAEYFDFLVTVSFIANNSYPVDYKDIYYPSAVIRFLKSIEPDKPPVILFGGNGTEHRYIYDPPTDSRLWLWETAGAGGGFWNCYFNGSHPANTLDRRNAYLASDAYRYVLDNHSLIHNLLPVTDIAVFYSKATGQFLGDDDFSLPLKGIFRLLEEGHYQYGFVTDRQLTPEILKRYKLLIMPNIAVLNEEDAGTIRNWVASGGKLIATFKTSLYDTSGIQREDFLLSDVFGAHYDGKEVSTDTDCYQKIVTRNAIVKGFEKTMLLHNSGNTLLVNPAKESVVVTGYLPKINNQPPENAFPETWDSHHPIVVVNDFGDGKAVYFANEIDKLNYLIGHPDYNDLLENSIRMLLNDQDILKTNAPASVHVYLNRDKGQPDVYQLSIINTSSVSRRPLRDLIPVNSIKIEVPFTIKNYEVLSGEEVRVVLDGGDILLNNLGEFCSIRLED